MSFVLELRDVAKSFTLHLQGGTQLSIVAGVTFSVRAGECVVLSGPSGAGKSSILKMIFGNYRQFDGADVRQMHVDIAIDPAGDIWVGNNWQMYQAALAHVDEAQTTLGAGEGLVVFYGMAKPVRTPLIGPPRKYE